VSEDGNVIFPHSGNKMHMRTCQYICKYDRPPIVLSVTLAYLVSRVKRIGKILFSSIGIVTDNKHAIDLLAKVIIHPIDFDW
jgi:hypothetical protein